MKKEKLKMLVAISLIASLGGCGSGKDGTCRVLVVESGDVQRGIKTINIVSEKQMPQEHKIAFEKNLRKKLFKKQTYKPGGVDSDLTVSYRFLMCDEGDRLTRMYWGRYWGAMSSEGNGILRVEARFINRAGVEVGKVEVEGKMSHGFYGGNFEDAVLQASDHLARYIIGNFRH